MGLSPRRKLLTLLALLTAVTVLVPPSPAAAEPGQPAAPSEDEPPLLAEVLEVAGRRYVEAKAEYEASRKRQLGLSLDLRDAELRLEKLRPQVEKVAVESYQIGKLTPAAMLLNSSSSGAFVDRIVALDELNTLNDRKLAELNRARDEVATAKAALDAEVQRQQEQLTVMRRQKREAEKALALVGGKSVTAGGLVAATSPKAKPAPRNPDGTWPRESCTADDPTTSGCLTPRTLHAYQEVRRAGFDMYAACWRPGDKYEHPKGRACDWSLRSSGFGPPRNQQERIYGNNLTAFLVRNADELGILYVIWWRQIWFPATGWKSYSGPSAHIDHVHMSIL
ncbi:MAG TPA: hypothetical protein VF174_12250 [Micromonosporaceae bacterium]